MLADFEPGSYVLAVSGGVDSVALLDMLAKLANDPKNKLKLTVAHFDHGIREDSNMDRQLVAGLAKKYGLPFVYDSASLGYGASEELARNARYEFLRKVQAATGAQALVTAHHQDDLIETAILNILRGTGRKGISSLADRSHLRRPLLAFPKEDLKHYAAEQGLVWREDSTNADNRLLRNYVRNVLIPRLGKEGRAKLLNYINHIAVANRAIDNELLTILHQQPSRQTLDRRLFVSLPHDIAIEVLAEWLRSHGVPFDSKMLETLTVYIKTLAPGKQVDINAAMKLLIGTDVIAIVAR